MRPLSNQAQAAEGPGTIVKSVDEIFFDEQGLIVQQDGDGGDTAQREGMFWLGTWVRASGHLNLPWPGSPRLVTFQQVMERLEAGQTGLFRRHPTQTKLVGEPPFRGPMNDPKTTSRDQMIPLIAAMGVHNDRARLQRFRHELRRTNWFVNRDTLKAFEDFINRAFDEEPNRSRDVLTTSLGIIARFGDIAAAKDPRDDVGDDLNMMVRLLLATLRKPNDTMSALRESYAKNRPDNYGMYLGTYRQLHGTDWNAKNAAMMIKTMREGIDTKNWKSDCPRVLGALRWYFRAEQGGSPGIANLYQPIIEKWFQ